MMLKLQRRSEFTFSAGYFYTTYSVYILSQHEPTGKQNDVNDL